MRALPLYEENGQNKTSHPETIRMACFMYETSMAYFANISKSPLLRQSLKFWQFLKFLKFLYRTITIRFTALNPPPPSESRTTRW